jgi:hypothetical protein
VSRARLEFGTLVCTAGVPGADPCQCRLCLLERLEAPDPLTYGASHPLEVEDIRRFVIRGSRYDHAKDYQGNQVSRGTTRIVTWVTPFCLALAYDRDHGHATQSPHKDPGP